MKTVGSRGLMLAVLDLKMPLQLMMFGFVYPVQLYFEKHCLYNSCTLLNQC